MTRRKASGITAKSSTTMPMVHLKKVWHVGSMDRTMKKRNSHEGAGLSISLHPGAWRYIGEGMIDGSNWCLKRKEGIFLDALEMSERQRMTVIEWGLSQGYVVAKPVWRWSYWDDELDDEVYQEFLSRSEAEEESEDEDEPNIVEMQGYASTPLLDDMTMHDRQCIGLKSVLDMLLPIYAGRELDCDGVWWDERLDPVSYSAPRGVILVERLSDWKASKHEHGPDDGEW